MKRRNMQRWRMVEARLGRESTIWLATVRADGRPHLVPVWFVWLDGRLYFSTGSHTQKFKNMRQNQKVSLALPDTDQVIMIEGEAHTADPSLRDTLGEYFFNKYEWDFRYDDSIDWRLVEVTPEKLLAWGDEEEDEIRLL